MFIAGTSATAMRIATYQAQSQRAVEQSMARLAAGRRFTSFADDPVAATKEISLRALQGASGLHLRATQEAAAAADAAAAGLQTASDLLIELRNDVLALDTGDPASVAAVQQQVTTLTAGLTRLAQTTTTAAGMTLLDGSGPLTFTVASSGTASDQVQLTGVDVRAAQLGTLSLKLDAIDFTAGMPTTQADALAAIDAAQAAVKVGLASTGAVSSAMGYHASALGSQISGLDAGLENLVGVDVAQESLALSISQMRQESAVAMLAQVNAMQMSMIRQLLMGR